MKLSVTQENLSQGLGVTSHISAKNINLPILGNVLLRATKGGLKLTSTNLEMTITCHIRGKVEQEGEYTVPSKLFFDYVNLLQNEKVDIDLVDGALAIHCGNAKTKIKGIEPSEFPLVPPVKATTSYSCSVSEFKQAISSVLFAAASNEARPELAGVYLAFHHKVSGDGTLRLAATDSYRLAENIVKLSGGSEEAREVIVPARTMSEVSRILSVFKDDVEAPPAVEIELAGNQIVFRYGSVELTSPTIEKNYPDYRQIIPSDLNTEVRLDRAELTQAIKAASLFSKSGLFDINLKVMAESGELILSATDSTRGENAVRLAGEVSGADNETTLNFRFLLDGANAIDTPQVALRLIDAANPCVLVPHTEGELKQKYQYIVMPIRQ